MATKITMPEQELKDTFASGLLPIYKLLVISNHDISLGDMIDLVNNKAPCINKFYTMKNKYTSQNDISKVLIGLKQTLLLINVNLVLVLRGNSLL